MDAPSRFFIKPDYRLQSSYMLLIFMHLINIWSHQLIHPGLIYTNYTDRNLTISLY